MSFSKMFLFLVFLLQFEAVAYSKSLSIGEENMAATIKDLGDAHIVSENDLVHFFEHRGYDIKYFHLVGKAAWLDINEYVVLNSFARKEGRLEILVFNSPTELQKKRYEAIPSKTVNLGKDNSFKAIVLDKSNVIHIPIVEGSQFNAENSVLIVCFLPGATYVARMDKKNLMVYKPFRQK